MTSFCITRFRRSRIPNLIKNALLTRKIVYYAWIIYRTDSENNWSESQSYWLVYSKENLNRGRLPDKEIPEKTSSHPSILQNCVTSYGNSKVKNQGTWKFRMSFSWISQEIPLFLIDRRNFSMLFLCSCSFFLIYFYWQHIEFVKVEKKDAIIFLLAS